MRYQGVSNPSPYHENLYIAMISVHGLIRGENIELGRDADTGGQTKYVVELANCLAGQDNVNRVDLFTRQIFDKKISEDYAQPEERMSDHSFIIRKPFGPKRYLRKERLYPYLNQFAYEILKHFRQIGRMPDFIHAHYADAGFVGAKLAQLLAIPMIFTGHSLGRVKRKRLMDQGGNQESAEKKYNLFERIEAEELALSTASMVVASTYQEVEEQYHMYDLYQPGTMAVIPPGTDLSRFSPKDQAIEEYPFFQSLSRFLTDPYKPMVLAISRADERKNIRSLIQAYAEDDELRERTNLVIVAGNRDDIEELDSGARDVMRRVLQLIDKYDLYGSVAYPKHHSVNDVPDLYRMCAKTKGVFVNPALTEPFGLTLIEAAACGTPIVATNDGGPRDIIANCENGVLIDPLDTECIASSIKAIINNPQQWQQYADRGLTGVREHYSWDNHVKKYLETLSGKMNTERTKPFYISSGSRLMKADRLFVTDIDNTLLGDDDALERLVDILEEHSDKIGFGIATGRHLTSAVNVLQEYNVPRPDMLITSVGAEINFGDDLRTDVEWENHISYKWEPDRLKAYMKSIDGIELQPSEFQRKHKVSYFIDTAKSPSIKEITKFMRENNFKVKVIFSHGQFLDFLPLRASKGLAIWYLASKWSIPMERILTSGDSGNDEEMLRGHNLSVVVGNYSKELETLRKNPTVYFADAEYAGGILEGMEHFNFTGEIKKPEVETI